MPSPAPCDAAAPPRTEQSQQHRQALTCRPRLQGATVARMEVDGVAGLAVTGNDGNLVHAHILLLIIGSPPFLMQHGICMALG